MSTPFSRIFPDEDFGFHLRFERGNPAEFFAPTAEHQQLIFERQRWLRGEPEKYAGLLPPGEPLLADAQRCAQTWNGFPVRLDVPPDSALVALGEFWEADYLLLGAVGGGIRLFGGCLCFPSSWRLTDKLGKPMEFIHGPVPGLNESIGRGIHRFLAGLKPGAASLRHNWGLARSPELNHHPDRSLARFDDTTSEDEVWLRVEHQALVALPKTGGILFGIRVTNHPFAEVRADPVARARLRRALATMSEDVVRYKGLTPVRERLVDWLDG